MYLNVILGIILLGMLVFCLVKKKVSKINKGIILLCLLCIPFAMNSVYFVSKGMMHHLMTYSFCFPYILLILVLDYTEKNFLISREQIKRIIFCISFILIGGFLFRSIVYSNDIYLKKKLEYDNTLLVFNRIIDEIEELDNYKCSEETDVVFVGVLADSEYYRHRTGFASLSDTTGLTNPFSVTSYGRTLTND